MPVAAPRLDPRLIAQLERLARKALSPAEIRRSLVVRASALGIPPPSYEHVRRLVVAHRIEREAESETLQVALGVALGTRHGNELLNVIRDGSRKAT